MKTSTQQIQKNCILILSYIWELTIMIDWLQTIMTIERIFVFWIVYVCAETLIPTAYIVVFIFQLIHYIRTNISYQDSLRCSQWTNTAIVPKVDVEMICFENVRDTITFFLTITKICVIDDDGHVLTVIITTHHSFFFLNEKSVMYLHE